MKPVNLDTLVYIEHEQLKNWTQILLFFFFFTQVFRTVNYCFTIPITVKTQITFLGTSD